MAYTFDSNIVSDLHKDARGFRPTEYFWEEWTESPDPIKQKIWDCLIEELNDTMAAERAAQQEALTRFTKRVIDAQLAGAGDPQTAIRWICEAEGFEEYDYRYGADCCAFHFDLAYDNPFKEDFAAVCAQQLDRFEEAA